MNLLIILFHDVFALGIAIASIILSIQSLRISLQRKVLKISPILTVHFCHTLLWSLSTLVSSAYLIIFWRFDSVIYDARILYLTGLFSVSFLFSITIIYSFLCIDRCLSILFPLGYGIKWKTNYAVFTAIFPFSTLCLILWIKQSFNNNIPAVSQTECRNFACLAERDGTNSILTTIRIVMAVINISLAASLLLIIKNNIKIKNGFMKRVNKTVIWIIIFTIIFDFIPSLIGKLFVQVQQFCDLKCYLSVEELDQVLGSVNQTPKKKQDFKYNFFQIFDKSPIAFIGPYATSLGYLNCAWCLYICHNAIRKTFV